jgi:hypothetical protein
MPGLTPSSPPNASATVRGLVSTLAQTFAGVKTFLARAVFQLGITSGAARLDLRSDLGAGAADVCSVVGSTQPDGSVNAATRLFSVRTGLGETEVEKVWFDKQGDFRAASSSLGRIRGASASLGFVAVDDSLGAQMQFNALRWVVDSANATLTDTAVVGNIIRFGSNGAMSQRGTDSSGTPGAATIDRPTGISAIASGATSVTITNSLVAANSRVLVTWHADHGAARWWVTRAAGSFTVTLSAAATANAAFSWEVSSLL